MTVKYFSKQPLGYPAAHLELKGQPPGEFHQSMVQKGNSRFQRHPHRCPVNLDENIIGQIRNRIKVHHAMLEIPHIGPCPGVRQHRRRLFGAGYQIGRMLPVRHQTPVDLFGRPRREYLGQLVQLQPGFAVTQPCRHKAPEPIEGGVPGGRRKRR